MEPTNLPIKSINYDNPIKIVTPNYTNCLLCPNKCSVNRVNGELGVCKETDKVRVAWIGLHKGEEPIISGVNGSGMIFFTGCSLHCKYCQNYQISNETEVINKVGKEVSIEDLSSIMLKLQARGAETLNLVTGTHFIPSIVEALKIAKRCGLDIPVVWNSSGYEEVEALSYIDELIDIYLLDAKTLNPKTAALFCGKSDYAKKIINVLDYLHGNVRDKGTNLVIIRHLVFPGELSSTLDFLKVFSKNYKDKFILSLMVQFVDPFKSSNFKKITKKEYKILEDAIFKYEIMDGYVQELGEEEEWIPDFTQKNPFPSDYSEPVNF